MMKHFDGPGFLNVGTGTDVTIKELAELIADITDYRGLITWDTSQPDGTPQKLLNVDELTNLGWTYKISLREGIEKLYRWYLSNQNSLRT